MTYHYLQVYGPYRAKLVCFACRRGFKWPQQPPGNADGRPRDDGARRAWAIAQAIHQGVVVESDRPTCPSCGAPATPVHSSTAVPRSANERGWKKLQDRLREGAQRRDMAGWKSRLQHED